MTPEEAKKKAVEALHKPAPYGPDIDLSEYTGRASATSAEPLKKLGFDSRQALGAASYVQINSAILQTYLSRSLASLGVVFMPIRDAVRERSKARNYSWGLIDVGEDKYTALSELEGKGVYLEVPDNTHIKSPVYMCFAISAARTSQPVHNVIVIGENSKVDIVSACSSAAKGLHVGVTEIYVGKRSEVTYTMIHSWHPESHVRPRTAVRLSTRASFNMYYVGLGTGKSLQTIPRIELGELATMYSASVILAANNSIVDVGTLVEMLGEGGKAQVSSKIIARSSARVTNRISIAARAARTRGHTECSGLLLSDSSMISTIPALESWSSSAELTHEASIGKLDEEAIYYLMSRGLTEEEAVSLLVRGFASVEVRGVPEPVKKSLESALRALALKASG